MHTLISEPNCKPPRTKGRPLGIPFFLSIFVAYLICCIICVIILIFEHIFKPEKFRISPQSKRLNNVKEELIVKIDGFMDEIEGNDEDSTLLKKSFSLLQELRTFIE